MPIDPKESLVTCPACGLRFVPGSAGSLGPRPAGQAPQPASEASRPAAQASSPAAPASQPATNASRSAGQASAPTVPASRPAPRTAVAGLVGAPRGARKTILVAEDIEYFTHLVRDALGAKYRTITVGTVSEALKALDEERVDLLVLDLTLRGGEDGREVLRRLQSRDFPVLIFTARDETDTYGEMWKDLQSLGADDLLVKGMNVEEDLLKKVGTLLGKK